MPKRVLNGSTEGGPERSSESLVIKATEYQPRRVPGPEEGPKEGPEGDPEEGREGSPEGGGSQSRS